jgi:hypothetical protein
MYGILPLGLVRGRKTPYHCYLRPKRRQNLFLEETEPSAYRIAGPARHFRMSATETERTDDTGRGALYGFLTEVGHTTESLILAQDERWRRA